LFGLAVPVLACSAHGKIAGDKVDTWLDGSDDDKVGNTGFSVTGTQEGNEGGSNAGGWHWAWYSVTVTYPGSPTTTVTIKTAGNRNGWNASDNGTDLENWLAEEAKNVIKQADIQKSDYIG
jgi:hypothetical protein